MAYYEGGVDNDLTSWVFKESVKILTPIEEESMGLEFLNNCSITPNPSPIILESETIEKMEEAYLDLS